MARRNLEKKVGQVSLIGVEVYDMQDFLEEEEEDDRYGLHDYDGFDDVDQFDWVWTANDHFMNEGYYDMEGNYHFYADAGADYRLGPM